MQKMIYYVAMSIDGYIAGPGGDISRFLYEGPAVSRYQADLLGFKTVVMGRKTYEVGYSFGLQPGQPVYEGMKHYVFSDRLAIPDHHPDVSFVALTLAQVKKIKAQATTDIYLCGGGMLAAWLANHQQIDQLKVKLNPIVLGGGTKLFGDSTLPLGCRLVAMDRFEDGMAIITYDLGKP